MRQTYTITLTYWCQ